VTDILDDLDILSMNQQKAPSIAQPPESNPNSGKKTDGEMINKVVGPPLNISDFEAPLTKQNS